MRKALLASVVVIVVSLATLTTVLAFRLYHSTNLSTTVTVRVTSDPPGATLSALGQASVLGTTPLTMRYALPEQWRKCVSYDGLGASWPNGVQLEVKAIELCPEGGMDQEIRLAAPRRQLAHRTRVVPSQSDRSAPPGEDLTPMDLSVPDSVANAPATHADALTPMDLSVPDAVLQPAPGTRPDPLTPMDLSVPDSAPPSTAAPAVAMHQVRPAAPPIKAGARIPVRVVQRQSNETGYSFVVPGYVSTRSNAYAHCSGTERGSLYAMTDGAMTFGTYSGTTRASCSGSGSSTTTVAPPRQIAYEVRGATLSLRLPDGRVAVVNCDSKYSPKGDYINRRSCRVPPADQVEAQFKGEKAKLFWRVGISGEKGKSETYRLIEILEPLRQN